MYAIIFDANMPDDVQRFHTLGCSAATRKDPAFSLIDPIEDFEYYFSLYPGTTIEKPDNSRIFYCEVNGQESIIPAMGAYVTPGEYTAFVSKDGHYDGKSIYGYTLQTFSVTENPDRRGLFPGIRKK